MDFPDEPPSVSLREDVYRPLPQTSHLVDWDSVDAERTAGHVLKGLTRGLDENSLSTLEAMFREEGCHWRDTLALTAHLRTFCGKERIASVLADLSRQRGIGGVELASGSAQIVLAHGHTVSQIGPMAHGRCWRNKMLINGPYRDGSTASSRFGLKVPKRNARAG